MVASYTVDYDWLVGQLVCWWVGWLVGLLVVWSLTS
jgi:hypothetical protein